MTYDDWKCTDPRELDPDMVDPDEAEHGETEQVPYDFPSQVQLPNIKDLQAQIRRLEDALAAANAQADLFAARALALANPPPVALTDDEKEAAAKRSLRAWMASLPQHLRPMPEGPMYFGYLQGHRNAQSERGS